MDSNPLERPNLQLVTVNFQAIYRTEAPTTTVAPIVWAIDAFPDDLELQLKTAAALQTSFPDSPIYPIYVLSEDSFLDRGYSSYLKPALKPMAFKAVLRILAETNLSNLRKPRILLEGSPSRTACARRLLRFSKKIGALTIAVGSHARRGLTKFFAGSFTDELIDANEMPILIAGPHTQLRNAQTPISQFQSQPKTIVFPTDFSPACSSAFSRILHIARAMNAEVHLFHKQIYTIDPYAQAGMTSFGSGWISMDSYMPEMIEDHSSDIDRWKQQADEMNVAIRFVSENFREPTPDAIVDYVRSLNDSSVLLAMVSQTGPLAAALLGSVTRDVIRTCPCPIYVAPRFH